MERTHHGQHEDCFGCKVHSIQVNPYAMPSRLHPSNPPAKPKNSWEKGIPTDSRGMPFLNKNGQIMGQKEYAANRHSIEETRRRLHNSTEPVTP